MSSLQSPWLCRDFTEHRATPLETQKPSTSLVMKGSRVRVPSVASREIPARQNFPTPWGKRPGPRRGPSRATTPSLRAHSTVAKEPKDARPPRREAGALAPTRPSSSTPHGRLAVRIESKEASISAQRPVAPELPDYPWPRETMTVAEVATTIRFTAKTVRQHIRRGRLRAVQFEDGGPYSIHRDHGPGHRARRRSGRHGQRGCDLPCPVDR
jgi:excisionase family DNA binding protein